MTFVEYCLKNQYSTNQTRSQAFTMGSQSRQAEIDELQKRIDEAVKYLKDGLEDFYIDYVCEETLKILKGETNE